ncbi:flagellar assembly protein FliH [Bacillus sp. T33-2]|uniref:flagellar assembly protein FliH n=1 Tax=Bacillus sp. T33-2 TaxID=2054168 RepID=UPI000C7599F8|nr:flagellar assembly protein FliH [Bacillus sp. T33-2]PLR97276.1 flagellar assembly protein FliH [Bacillus sp. T33-2]
MISLSRLFKSQSAYPEQAEKRVISIRMFEQSGEPDEPPVFVHTENEKREILEQAARNAEKMVSEAVREAEQIRLNIQEEKQAWEQEKSRLASEAEGRGFEKGVLEGRKQGYSEYQATIQQAREVVESAKKDYHDHIEASEKTILQLGLKVAERILGKRIKEHGEDFLSLVKRALKDAREYRDIQLHVHPVHYGFLLSQKEELSAVFPKETDFYIFPDDDLSEGDCIIESINGRIDASVDSQLQEIKEKLLEMLESES